MDRWELLAPNPEPETQSLSYPFLNGLDSAPLVRDHMGPLAKVEQVEQVEHERCEHHGLALRRPCWPCWPCSSDLRPMCAARRRSARAVAESARTAQAVETARREAPRNS